MGDRLQGKVAFVTGAGQGIGRSIAEIFAREGARVVVATRTTSHGEETVRLVREAGGWAELHTIDVGDHAAARGLIDDVAARLGRLDILVHNAAAFGRAQVDTFDEPLLDRMLNVNLKACFALSAAVIPHLRKVGAGRILITSSVTGPHVVSPGGGYYGAGKAGVNGFIRTAAFELAGDDITVNGVEPGYIDTPGLSRLKERYGEANLAKYIPAKRLGRPDEIATAMLFLASDESSYITGQTIIVDGGAMLPESPLYVPQI
jgi:3-oxoacyl-[acyl-carrier protein] reductase